MFSFRPRVDVSSDEALDLSTLFQSDDLHRICHRLLATHLFALPLEVHVTRSQSPLKLPPQADLEKLVRRYYGDLARKALEDLLVYGYTFYTKTSLEDRSLGEAVVDVPARVHNADCQLYSEMDDDGVRRWKCERRSSVLQELDTKPLGVFLAHSLEPDELTGRHKSPVAATYTHSLYVSQLYALHVQAHTQRATPPLLVQQNKQTSSHETNWAAISRQNPSLLGASHEMKEVEIHYLKRGAEELDGIHSSTSTQRHLFTGVHGTQAKRVMYTPSVVSERVYIPSGWEVAPQAQLPEAQGDLLEYDSARKEDVLAMYGIPQSLVLSGARNSSKTSTNLVDDNDILMFGRTLASYKEMLEGYLHQVHLDIFPELEGLTNLEFSLPLVPFLSISRLIDLVDRDILRSSDARKCIADVAGIPRKYLLEEGEQNTHTRPPLQGNENQTTAIMKAKEAVMRAEAQKLRAEAKAVTEGEGGGELMDKEVELEKLQVEGKLKVMEAQKELVQVQTEAALKKASAQQKLAAKRKPPSS